MLDEDDSEIDTVKGLFTEVGALNGLFSTALNGLFSTALNGLLPVKY
jgi:hypothetical protein